MTLRAQMTQLAAAAKAASRELAVMPTDDKNRCLLAMAEALERNGPAIIEANQQDLTLAKAAGINEVMLERLRLDEKRVTGMANGLREVAALPDPVGRILDERVRPNGLGLQKVTVPIGVIVIIYESRPNVTADAASLCLKSGNATILRGGKEALHSNTIIANTMMTAAEQEVPTFPRNAIQVVPTTDRGAIGTLLRLTQFVDLCMPRGGEGLIRAVARVSKVPVIKHYKGVCHVFVERAADLRMAEAIVINAKTQRPSVCNAMESLLVDKEIASEFLPMIARKLTEKKVALRVDKTTRACLKSLTPPATMQLATEKDWSTEYNDLTLSVRVVDDLPAAIAHINRYGSGHSDSIVTKDEAQAKKFLHGVDSAAVYWNASTRFTDGGEFGMGAEIGISTDKIGARGPMGLEELTSYKWLGYGTGQIRT